MPADGPLLAAVVDCTCRADQFRQSRLCLGRGYRPRCERTGVTSIESLQHTFGIGGPPPTLTIGVGDAVNVTIWEAGPGGLFSTAASTIMAGSRTAVLPEQVVSREGTISIPYAGRLRVVGMHPGAVEDLIVDRLKGKAIEPQAVVTVSKNNSNTVSVSGEIVGGARVPLTLKGDRVLDVISAAGGLRAPADESIVRLTRQNRTVSVPYNAILARPSENIYLRGGDTLTVVRLPEQTFTVFGATGRNAASCRSRLTSSPSKRRSQKPAASSTTAPIPPASSCSASNRSIVSADHYESGSARLGPISCRSSIAAISAMPAHTSWRANS